MTSTLKDEVVYISGPMTGLPNYNYDEFNRVEKLLLEQGYTVINPTVTGVQDGWAWNDYLTADLLLLLTNNVTTVVLLDGWENSRGAKLEVHIAKELGMVVVPYKDFLEPKTVDFRDNGITFLSGIKRPAFLYSKDTLQRIKYGEIENINTEYENHRRLYTQAGYPELADELAIIELPADQDLIDRLFQASGELAKFLIEYTHQGEV